MDITDPAPVNWNLRLQLDSPCIDAGNDLTPDLPDTDLDGKPRRIDGDGNLNIAVDMGAYEYGDIGECDYDKDLDVDGADLVGFINDSKGYTIADFVEDFGRTDCPDYIQ